MTLSNKEVIVLKTAQLAMGAGLKELDWVERGHAIWEAFRLGQQYETAGKEDIAVTAQEAGK